MERTLDISKTSHPCSLCCSWSRLEFIGLWALVLYCCFTTSCAHTSACFQWEQRHFLLVPVMWAGKGMYITPVLEHFVVGGLVSFWLGIVFPLLVCQLFWADKVRLVPLLLESDACHESYAFLLLTLAHSGSLFPWLQSTVLCATGNWLPWVRDLLTGNLNTQTQDSVNALKDAQGFWLGVRTSLQGWFSILSKICKDLCLLYIDGTSSF